MGLNTKKTNTLLSELASRLLEEPDAAMVEAKESYDTDLAADASVLRQSLALVMRDRGVGVDAAAVELRVERINESDHRVDTNLGSFGIDDDTEHSIVERALLGVAGLNHRIALMDSFQAITGLRDNELPVFDRKLARLAGQLDPDAHEGRFDRVIEITGTPSIANIEPGSYVNIDRVLTLRAEPEWQDFRTLLRALDDSNGHEIEARVRSIREKTAAAFHSGAGQTIRTVISGAVGLAGLPFGLAWTAGDKFVADKLIGKPGPLSLLSRRYRSLFEA